ncbi:MAG: cellulase family glycosylhydrolase [Pseudomonadota bacterium]
MKIRQLTRQGVALFAIAATTANGIASAAPLCVDAVNPQYFYYNGKTQALVGYTPEYICHLEQRAGTPEESQLCNYNLHPASGKRNFQRVIDELAAKHLNVLRVWAGLGHSPGGAAGPLPHEQPFVYNPADGRWNLNAFNQTWFDRLKEVVAYAQSRNVVVEVTLFDAFSGDFRTSPWYTGKNSSGYLGLADEWTLTAAPGATCAPFNTASNIYSRQKALVEKLVAELNVYDNVYWELANEPELSFIRAGFDSKGASVADSVALPRIVKWHECMTDIVRNAEGTATSPKRHLIAANYHTQVALAPFRSVVSPTYAPHVRILNGHYIKVRDAGRLSATEKVRTYLNGGLQGIDRIHGFNEGRPTPSYRSSGSFDYITPDEARAEAWEFMLSEGGLYNHYTTDWSASGGSEPAAIRTQLGKLADFLNGLSPHLRNMGRSINDPPAWAPNLPVFGTPRGGSNVYWGAMHQPGSTYVLYIHHSNPSADSFKAYTRPASITPLTTIDLQPAAAATAYTATWINPSTGAAIGSSFAIPADGVRRSYAVPGYAYDIALKIGNGVTAPVMATCAP